MTREDARPALGIGLAPLIFAHYVAVEYNGRDRAVCTLVGFVSCLVLPRTTASKMRCRSDQKYMAGSEVKKITISFAIAD